MKINRNIAALLAVAGLAYAAGHFGAFTAGTPGAWGQVQQEQEQQMPPEMLPYIEAGMPGRYHHRLDALVGEWEGEFRFRMEPDVPFMVSRGTISREWILDGRFLKENVEAQFEADRFQGLGFIGYNNLEGRYQFIWMDSMSTAILTATGTYHPDTNVLHIRGTERDPVTGRVINTWGKMDLSDPDRHPYTGYSTTAAGRTYVAFEGMSVRKKN